MGRISNKLEIEINCTRCKEMVVVEHLEITDTKRGIPAARSICPVCGVGLFKLIKKKDFKTYKKASIQMEKEISNIKRYQ